MTRSSEQVHGIEPRLQGRSGALKRGASAGVNVEAAQLATEGRTLAQFVEFCGFSALRIRAHDLAPITQVHDVQKAGIVIRELCEELFDCQRLSHTSLLPMDVCYYPRLRVSRGYMPR